ncbi:hypothetical protein [Treponema pectinovorum]|uniref:hypothetical protein n=2 Tax=Treponema pectinovorum TaxID=164 RepID=UPI0011CB9FF3|nr:hypothetical protein [Treponema pectinovorum]
MKKSILICLPLVLIFLSCYVPSPLYGTWADNDGNKISFMEDRTFVSIIKDSVTGLKTTYEGDYSVINNTVSFKTSSGEVVNSEWDIRGAMLYITWTKNKVTYNLSLYHVSK